MTLDADHAGRLWVLTDEGYGVRAASRDPMRRAVSRSATSPALPAARGLKKPEGLIVLDDDVALVGCDKPDRDQPLYAVSGVR